MKFGIGSYPARLVRVCDGDTAVLVLDVGFRLTFQDRLRLSGINCPELHAQDPVERARAERALQFASSWLTVPGQWPLRVVTEKSPDDYGRWLARIYKPGASANAELCLNDDLLSAGLAVVYKR